LKQITTGILWTCRRKDDKRLIYIGHCRADQHILPQKNRIDISGWLLFILYR